MKMLIAAAHIIGSIVVLSVLGAAWFLIVIWENRRNARIQSEDIALELGISSDDEIDEEMRRKVRLWLASRYSSELLRNRLSDLCGIARTCWDAIGILVVASTLCVVMWHTVSDGADNAPYAWLAVLAWIVFAVAGTAFALLCKLLTGRYPGQARAARKSLAKSLCATG